MQVHLESTMKFDETIVSNVLVQGANEIVGKLLSEHNIEAMKNDSIEKLIVSLTAIGLNVSGLYILRKSIETGSALSIYRNSGLLFGITFGALLYYNLKMDGNKSKTFTQSISDYTIKNGGFFKTLNPKNKEQYEKDVMVSTIISKTANFLLTSVGRKIVSKLLKPFMRPAYILMRPFYKLPQYADTLGNMNANTDANNGAFTSFLIAFGAAAFASFSLCSLIMKSKEGLTESKTNNIKSELLEARKVLMESASAFNDVSKVAEITPNIKFNKIIMSNYLNFMDNAKDKKVMQTISLIKSKTKNVFNFNESVSNTDSSQVTLKSDIRELMNKLNIRNLTAYTNKASREDPTFVLKAIHKTLSSIDEAVNTNIGMKITNVVISVGKFSNYPPNTVEFVSPYNAAMNIKNGTLYVAYENVNSQAKLVTKRELTAIVLHEIGHYDTRQRSVLPLRTISIVASLMNSFSGTFSGFTEALMKGSFAMYVSAFYRYFEIQADKYAMVRGYGKELATALSKITHNMSTVDDLSVHSVPTLRINAIMQYANKYNKINNTIKKG